jgi:hypothetical protein
MTDVTSHGRETALHQDMLYGFSVIICYVKLKTNTCQFYKVKMLKTSKREKKNKVCVMKNKTKNYM